MFLVYLLGYLLLPIRQTIHNLHEEHVNVSIVMLNDGVPNKQVSDSPHWLAPWPAGRPAPPHCSPRSSPPTALTSPPSAWAGPGPPWSACSYPHPAQTPAAGPGIMHIHTHAHAEQTHTIRQGTNHSCLVRQIVLTDLYCSTFQLKKWWTAIVPHTYVTYPLKKYI